MSMGNLNKLALTAQEALQIKIKSCRFTAGSFLVAV